MKKVLSLLLIALLIISMAPVNVFATVTEAPNVLEIKDITHNSAKLSIANPAANASYSDYSISAGNIDASGQITNLSPLTDYTVTVKETITVITDTFFPVERELNPKFDNKDIDKDIDKDIEKDKDKDKVENDDDEVDSNGNGKYLYFYINELQEKKYVTPDQLEGNGNSGRKLKNAIPVATFTTNILSINFKTIDTPTYTVTVVVENGGIAYINGTEYPNNTGNTATITGKENTKITIKSYANASNQPAGFVYDNTLTASGRVLDYTITKNDTVYVKFSSIPNVSNMPGYVLDGGFSGYHPDGTDISNHKPQDDILAATMKATTNKTIYAAGEKATVALDVTVSDGDGTSKELVEVMYYQNGASGKFAQVAPSKPAINYEIEIPATIDALLSAGYSFNPANNLFEKSFNYALVDIYNGDAAAAQIATASTVIKVNYSPDIIMTLDNVYKLYINGVQQTPIFTAPKANNNTYDWQTMEWYDYGNGLSNGDVIAVEGVDQGVVAGFLGNVYIGSDTFPTAKESFWRQSNVYEAGWNLPSFDMTKAVNWKKSSEFTYGSWTGLIGLPSGSTAKWIWSSNNNYNNGGDKTVYFRYVVGGNNIDYVNIAPVITLKGEAVMSVVEGSSFTDPGTMVTDDLDKTLVATATGTVDTSKTGDYTITYNVTDNGGLSAVPVTRTVKVVAKPAVNQKPVITLNTPVSITLEEGATFTDPGASANDPEDGARPVTATGTVNTKVPGTYTITYTAKDTQNLEATPVTRTVVITAKPVTTNPETETGTENNNGNNGNNGNNSPATTEPNEVDIETEANALGSAAGNTEATTEVESTEAEIQPVVTVEETTEAEEIELFDEQNALGDALPKTGQLPAELFYGIGGLLSAAGVFLRKGKK